MVDEHHGAEGAKADVVPHEAEAVLPGGAEQVHDQRVVDGDAPKSMATVVVVFAPMWRVSSMPVEALGPWRSGAERFDLGDRPDEGGLADADPPAMTNLTDVMRVAALSAVDCTARNLVWVVVRFGRLRWPGRVRSSW